jgi:hypothetical protein
MEVTKELSVTIKDGDLELRVGRIMSSFAYKGQDKFMFYTRELKPLCGMIEAGMKDIEAFYANHQTSTTPEQRAKIREVLAKTIGEVESSI